MSNRNIERIVKSYTEHILLAMRIHWEVFELEVVAEIMARLIASVCLPINIFIYIYIYNFHNNV